MQVCIGRFADPTIALSTEEINLGIAEKRLLQNRDHTPLYQFLYPNDSPKATIN